MHDELVWLWDDNFSDHTIFLHGKWLAYLTGMFLVYLLGLCSSWVGMDLWANVIS